MCMQVLWHITSHTFSAAAAAADAEDDESIDGDGAGQTGRTTKSTTPTEHPGTLADGTASVEIDFPTDG